MSENTQHCPRCEGRLSLVAFPERSRGQKGEYCSECRRAYMREYMAARFPRKTRSCAGPDCTTRVRPPDLLCSPCRKPARPASAPQRISTYEGAHRQVRRQRGKASAHACVECGNRADEWAYDHADPDEVQGEHPYSLKPEHYHPMCRSCHYKGDLARGRRIRCMVDGCTTWTYAQYCSKHRPWVKPPRKRSAQRAPTARDAVKTCCDCLETKSVTDFYEKKPGCYRCRCRECDAAYSRSRYRSGDYKAEYAQNRVEAIRIYGGCCVWCGATDELEFDHVNGDGLEHRRDEPSTRLMARIVRVGRRITDYELRLLCVPCHRGPGWRERRAEHDGRRLTSTRRAA